MKIVVRGWMRGTTVRLAMLITDSSGSSIRTVRGPVGVEEEIGVFDRLAVLCFGATGRIGTGDTAPPLAICLLILVNIPTVLLNLPAELR